MNTALHDHITALEPAAGIWVGGGPTSSGDSYDLRDPATGQVTTGIANGRAHHARLAVDAAEDASPGWVARSPRDRSDVLIRAHRAMLADIDELAALISLESGKSNADARSEVAYAAEFFRWYAEEAVRSDGQYGPGPAGGTRTIVTARPVGIAALVTPWNFPAAMVTRKVAPALAAGCTTVLKPATETPLTALAIARILADAGAPPGAFNVVPSDDPADVVTALLEDPRVRKLSFTGSTAVGRTLLAQASKRILNVSMELGGNAPFVVTADADITAAIGGAMIAKFRNSGQACTAANRLYVHAAVADEFNARFAAAIDALRVGPPSTDSQVGPLIRAGARDRISRLVEDAVGWGARIATSQSVPADGYFYPPTLLTHVDPEMAIVQEEVFGPVAPVVTWEDEEQLLAELNGTEMGLTAYVYSGRLEDALRLAESLEAGMVGINRGLVSDPSAPFGGVKQSGLGREGGREGLREFTETQYYSVAWPA